MSWKTKLYENYLTTGMSGGNANLSEKFFEQHKYTAKRLLRYLPKEKSATIIDLGCGSGGLLYCLKKSGYKNLKGVDYSIEQVKIAKSAGLDFIEEGDLTSFLNGIKDFSVDVFMLMDVIEHFERDELFNLLSIMRRKIGPNGQVIIHIPNAEGILEAEYDMAI